MRIRRLMNQNEAYIVLFCRGTRDLEIPSRDPKTGSMGWSMTITPPPVGWTQPSCPSHPCFPAPRPKWVIDHARSLSGAISCFNSESERSMINMSCKDQEWIWFTLVWHILFTCAQINSSTTRRKWGMKLALVRPLHKSCQVEDSSKAPLDPNSLSKGWLVDASFAYQLSVLDLRIFKSTMEGC